jgi:gliding motility-associated-like protein
MKRFIWLIFTVIGFTVKAQQVVELCPDTRTSFLYWASASTSSGGWLWTLDNNAVSHGQDVRINWTDTGYFNIKVVYYGECKAITEYYKVHVIECVQSAIFFPNAFTPNDDGLNDGWHPLGAKIPKVEYTIWNRWGEKVYTGHSMNDRWNGKYKGQKADLGAYVVQATWRDINGKVGFYKGFVILIR